MRSKRFVLDANIWVSYFITETADVLAFLVIEYGVKIYYCEELLTELTRVLQYSHLSKYNIDTREAVKTVKKICLPFKLTQPIKKYLTTDQDDNYVIALALQTNSGFVTSGDRDILDEKERLEQKFKKLKIITKAEFENIFLG